MSLSQANLNAEMQRIGIEQEYNSARQQYIFAIDAGRYSQQQANALMGLQAGSLYPLGGRWVPPVPSATLTLKERREARWRQKLFRMKDKAIEKRIAAVAKAAWIVGWVWASLLIFVATSYLLRWSLNLITG